MAYPISDRESADAVGIEILTAIDGVHFYMTKRVDSEEVRHVASLARITLDDDEVDRFATQFADILEYCQTLEEVPEVDDEPDLVNVMRNDEVRDGLSQEDALRNAAATEDGFFKGPRVS